MNLTNALATHDIEEVTQNIKAELDYFKAQVKAIKILDNYLEDYENKTREKTTGNLCYTNRKLKDGDNLLSFIGALHGETYSNANYSAMIVLDASNQRLKKFGRSKIIDHLNYHTKRKVNITSLLFS